jgi:TetR/AcrR family transcriptional regulator, repressor of fatR-cypB operon
MGERYTRMAPRSSETGSTGTLACAGLSMNSGTRVRESFENRTGMSACATFTAGLGLRKNHMRETMKTRRNGKKNSLIALESDPASKREILKAALSLFVRHGPSDPTAREIAAQAGYSNPAIFKYFRTKDKLALYVFKQCYVRMTDELNGAIQLERHFHDNLKALLGAYQRIVQEDLDAFLYATENLRRFRPSLSPELRARSLGGLLRQVFENGKVEGVVGQDADIELLVVGVIGLVSQFARLLYFGEFREPARDWIATMERMIIKMSA